MENTLKLIISRKGTYVYESSEMIHGRTKKYLIEKYQYPVYLHYSPDMAGAYPMSYTWQLSVVEINEAGDIIHLEDRTARACKRGLQAPWKASILNCLRGINSGDWGYDPLADDYKKIRLAWEKDRNLTAAAPEMLEMLKELKPIMDKIIGKHREYGDIDDIDFSYSADTLDRCLAKAEGK